MPDSIAIARKKAEGGSRREKQSRAAPGCVPASSFILPPSSLPSLITHHSSRYLEEPRRVASDYLSALGLREITQALDHVHGSRIAHVGRAVTSHHHTIGADLADEVHEDAVAVRDRVVVEPAQVRGWRLRHVLALLADRRTVVHAPDQRRKDAAGVGQHHVKPRKIVHCSAEYERRRRDAGFGGVADEIAKMVLARAL